MGLKEYVHDAWNLVDFFTNSLYVATIALRLVIQQGSHFDILVL